MAEATITSITRISPDVRQYAVELEGGAFEGEPGQHTTIHKPKGWLPWSSDGTKPYTPVAFEDDAAILAIRTYDGGTVSGYMGSRSVGDAIEVEPSLSGNLHLRDASRPVAFVSTGTGITPMLAMLHEYLARDGPDATFVFGEKTEDQLLYRSMLEQLEHVGPVDVEFVLSRASWRGREGYVQEHPADVLDSPGSRDCYVCGVPEMVVETTERLADAGADEERIFTEGWEEGAVE